MTIVSARLRGRRPERDDIDYRFEIDSDPDVQRTLFGKLSTRNQSESRLQKWIDDWQAFGIGFWLFAGIDDGIVAGHAGLFPSRQIPGRVELGYTVKPKFWGMGYATEMARAVIAVAFNELGLESVVANAMPENVASRRVLERVGFSFVRDSLYDATFTNVEYQIKRRDVRRAAS